MGSGVFPPDYYFQTETLSVVIVGKTGEKALTLPVLHSGGAWF